MTDKIDRIIENGSLVITVEEAPPDGFFNLLWRLIKVVWRYLRLAYAAFLGVACVASLTELHFIAALLMGAFAWLIWPLPIRRRRVVSGLGPVDGVSR